MKNNNRFKHRGPKPVKPRSDIKGDRQLWDTPIDKLGLSEKTSDLLSSNNIATFYDLMSRTEREMFKIQTFSKKHLFELKDKMSVAGIEFYVLKTAPEAAQPQGNRQSQLRRDDQHQKQQTQDRKSSAQDKQQPKKNVLLPVERWRKVNKNGKWGFNNGLATVIQPEYDEVFLFKEGLACVEKDEKFGFIDSSGEVVIPLEYDCAMSFSEGLASVQMGEKCGYIDTANNIVIPCRYDAATPFEKGQAKVKEFGTWYSINKQGEKVAAEF